MKLGLLLGLLFIAFNPADAEEYGFTFKSKCSSLGVQITCNASTKDILIFNENWSDDSSRANYYIKDFDGDRFEAVKNLETKAQRLGCTIGGQYGSAGGCQ
jgi:hypothetical protein